MSEQLVAYIQDALNKGASKEHIIKALSDSGWKESDIQHAFSLLGKNGEQNSSQSKPFSIKFLTFFYLLFSVLFIILTIWSLQQIEPGPAPFFTGFIAIFSIITAVSLFLFNAAFLIIVGTSTLILLLFLFYLVFLLLDPIQNLLIVNTLQPIFSEAGLTLFVTWAIFYAIAFCFGFTLVIVLKTLAEKLMKQPTRKGLMAFLIFIALVIPMLLLSLKLATGIKKYSTYKENTVQAVAQISMSDFIEETVPDLNDILSETDTLFLLKADLTIPKTREYYVSVDFILPLKDNVAASVPFISLNDSPENIFFIGQLNAGLNKVTIYMHPLDKGNQIKVEVYDVKPGAISPGVFLLKKQHLTQQ